MVIKYLFLIKLDKYLYLPFASTKDTNPNGKQCFRRVYYIIYNKHILIGPEPYPLESIQLHIASCLLDVTLQSTRHEVILQANCILFNGSVHMEF